MSNDAVKKGLKNIKYTFIAQLVVMGAGVLKTLLIPSFLSIESYGYWQIYLFYLSYIGFFYLGFNDGVLLKYGKYDYDKLPFTVLRSSMRFYLIMLAIFSITFGIYANGISDIEKQLIMKVIAASILMYGINGVLVYVFLITNQIKLYSFFTSMDQIVILGSAIIMLLVENPNYRLLVAASFISKFIMVLAMMYICKELFLGKSGSLTAGLKEFLENIRYGLALMLAQIMSMLLTGLGRLFVEYFGDIKEYAFYSFGMSVISIVMVCVTAVATVMYPMMSRVDGKNLSRYFNSFCNCVTVFNAVALVSYFPASFFVKTLFVKYIPILEYLYILFALLTWQAKINIVTNSYFRVLRKEKQMFGINAAGVVFFTTIGLPAMFSSHSVSTVALCTFLTIVFIEVLSEIYLRRQLNLCMSITTLKDIIISAAFIICCIGFELTTGLIVYSIFVIVYITYDRKIVMDIFRKLLDMRKE